MRISDWSSDVCSSDLFNDHQRIYAVLDKVHAHLPQMILLHGATPTGAERIAASWARDRGVPQKPYKPDWNRHKKAAPFKRNDAMLDDMPKGVIIFPGTGIQDNLAEIGRAPGRERGVQ